MIDYLSLYGPRIEDLLDFMRSEMGVIDRQAIRIWLSCLLPAQKGSSYPQAWVALETNYSTPFTFTYLNKDRVFDFLSLTRERPRAAKQTIANMTALRWEPFTLLDSTWRRPVRGINTFRHPYFDFRHVALKVRVDSPLGPLPPVSKFRELGAMIDTILDPHGRPEDLLPSPWVCPERIVSMGKLLVDLNVDYLDHWMSVYRNISMLIRAHANLHGRTEPEEDDIWAGERVLRNSVRIWVYKILEILCASDGYTPYRVLMSKRPAMSKKELRKVVGELENARVVSRKFTHYLPSEEVRSFMRQERSVY